MRNNSISSTSREVGVQNEIFSVLFSGKKSTKSALRGDRHPPQTPLAYSSQEIIPVKISHTAPYGAAKTPIDYSDLKKINE